MRLWFWGWLIAAGAIAVVATVTRDRASAPFAAGAACAAALEAFGVPPGAQWIAFAGVSAVLFVITNGAWYRAKHTRTGVGRHGAHTTGKD